MADVNIHVICQSRQLSMCLSSLRHFSCCLKSKNISIRHSQKVHPEVLLECEMGKADKKGHRLYVRLPVKIAEEKQILDLHPKISIVHLPRQKSRRWCTIEFPNKSDLEEVRKAIRKLKINNKPIVVKPFKIPNKEKVKRQPQDLSSVLLA